MRAIIVHGGAGKHRSGKFDEKLKVLREAALRGFEILKERNDAVRACVEAVKHLEDSPLFNAGTGSVLTLDGRCEMDACIMRGDTLEVGAVAGLERVKNPIEVALKVMEETDHAILMGQGALKFARLMGFEDYDPVTPERREQWKKYREELLEGRETPWKKVRKLVERFPELLSGTVGCVALDEKGTIVAASSTGGVFLKLLGRVGDTPVPGAGVYAMPQAGATATGIGEGVIRTCLSMTTCTFIKSGMTPQEAVEKAIELVNTTVKTDVGIIALDCTGEIGFAYNTRAMPVAYMREDFDEVVTWGVPENEV